MGQDLYQETMNMRYEVLDYWRMNEKVPIMAPATQLMCVPESDGR